MTKTVSLTIAAVLMCGTVHAQTLSQAERRARMDSVLATRYYKTPYDSDFDDDAVTVNQNKWRARAFVGMRL